MSNLPVVQDISPEGLSVAEAYLQTNSIQQTAKELDLSTFAVSDILKTREVKQYIDTMYLEAGYRNRDKIGEAMDKIIEVKLEEMEESEMGSSKDIAELLMMQHKIRMDEMAAMAKLESSKINNQTNVQINSADAGGVNYQALLGKILK